MHLQTHDDLLLVIHNKNMFAQPDMTNKKACCKGTVARHAAGVQDWSAGTAVHDIKNPAAPRRSGCIPVQGSGLHRIWHTGGRWAYVSALLDGFTDYIPITIDMADPTKPEMAAKFWFPGMNAQPERRRIGPWRRIGADCTIPSCTATWPSVPGAMPALRSLMRPTDIRQS